VEDIHVMTLTLGQLKEELQKYAESHSVRFDCPLRVQPTKFASWRGIYAELALGYETVNYSATEMTVGMLLSMIKIANGSTYEGWKGGLNRMNLRTPVHVDNRGCYTDTAITGVRFDGTDVLITVKSEED
jgi:hypothetical protein